MEQALTLQAVKDEITAAQAGIEAARVSIASAEAEVDRLMGEIADLLAAARVIAKYSPSDAKPSDQSQPGADADQSSDFNPNERQGNPYRSLTNKAYMWKALADSDKVWLNANEVQQLAARLRGAELPMSSVSPGLSEMKSDGIIERDGMKVALKSRLNENGAAEAAPDAEEVGASSTDNRSGSHLFD